MGNASTKVSAVKGSCPQAATKPNHRFEEERYAGKEEGQILRKIVALLARI
jgi:hypothetical protein